MSEIQALKAENEKLKAEAVKQRRLLKRLVLDFSITIRSPIPRLIIWPQALEEVDALALLIGEGRNVLQPEERLAHIERPLADLDNSTVVMLQRFEASLTEEPKLKKRSLLMLGD
jgi:hypothetical protein